MAGSYQVVITADAKRHLREIAGLVESNNENIALRASDSILDRQLGKPTQQIVTTNKKVFISIDLTGKPTPD